MLTKKTSIPKENYLVASLNNEPLTSGLTILFVGTLLFFIWSTSLCIYELYFIYTLYELQSLSGATYQPHG